MTVELNNHGFQVGLHQTAAFFKLVVA